MRSLRSRLGNAEGERDLVPVQNEGFKRTKEELMSRVSSGSHKTSKKFIDVLA